MADSESTVSRHEQMVDGAERVREPQFHTQQRVGVGGYRKVSVLDNLQPSGNGMSALDRQRQMFGVKSIGQGEDTAEKSIWLRNPSNPSQYQSFHTLG